MSYTDFYKLEKKDGIAIITMDRPQKFNTLSADSRLALLELSNDIIGDTSLRVIVLLANGKHFCAGVDLEYFAKVSGNTPGRSLYNIWNFQRAYMYLQTNNLPVIAGIQGVCLGEGLELAAACDIRVAADNARFALPEVKYGLSSDLGGCTRLTKLIGPGQAKRLAITAEEIQADEALRIGLVEKVVPLDKLQDTVMDMAKRVASLAPIPVQMAKKCINLAVDSSYAAGLISEEIQGIYTVGSKDKAEAMAAYKEKRPANFTME